MAGSEAPKLSIEEVDRDGAVRETADRVGGATRASFLKKGALIGGGLVAGAIPVAIATSQGGLPSSDVEILNFALTLEHLEAEFYKEAVAEGALRGDLAEFARVVADHEAQHVAALQKTLGEKAISKPSFDFKGKTSAPGKFAATAVQLEDTGVSAYLGQAGRIKTPAVLLAAASILPIEARHASWIRDIQGRGDNPVPAPNDFEKPRTKQQVQQIVDQTGFVQ